VQEPLAGIEPAVMLTDEVPVSSHAKFLDGILMATVSNLGSLVCFCILRPLSGAMQVELTLPEVNTPLGNVSVSGAVRLAILLPELVNVMVRVETPPGLMVDGLKDLLSEGTALTTGRTVKVASAGAALLPLLVTKAPAAIVLK
jgi:hypothetical protein